MRIITIKNPLPLETPFTIVSSDYSSGSLLSVEDSSGFKDNHLILVGGLGNEKTEATDLVSNPPSTNSLSITGMDHGHSSDESVQAVLWDKFDVEYRTDSTAAWQSLATTQAFDWSGDETSYIHPDGVSNYYYRVRYYNSASANYSDWSDIVSGVGSTRSSVGYMVDQVRKNAKDKTNQKVTDEDIIGYFNAVHDIVKSMSKKWPWLQGEATIDPSTLALPSDFKKAYRLKYNLVDGSVSRTYYLKYLTEVDFQDRYSDNNASTSDYLVHYSIDNVNQKILLGPEPTTTTAILTLVYEKDILDLETYADTTIVPIPDLLIAYATARVFLIKSDQEQYDVWMSSFSDLLQVLDQARPISYHPRTLKRYQGHGMDKVEYTSEDYI